MEITIIDISISFDEFNNVSRLLWSVVPFAKKIHLASLLSNLILYDLNKDKMSERAKVDYIEFTNSKNEKLPPEKIEKIYQDYLHVKSLKHKNKDDLIFISRLKKSIDSLYLNSIERIFKIEEEEKIKELHSLFAYPHKGVIGCFDLEPHGPDEYCAYEVEMVTTTILNDYEIPLFTEGVEKYINNEKPDEGLKNIAISRDKFLEFVSPRSLTINKLEIIRNELIKLYEPYGEKLKALKSDLLSKDEIIGAEEAGLFYRSNILPLAKDLQEAINENIYFQQIANSGEETERFTLYFCVCSVEDLLLLFENVAFVPKETIDYSREELKEKIDLKRSTFFLYLKVNEDGNNDN
jgi:hypothetical protein